MTPAFASAAHGPVGGAFGALMVLASWGLVPGVVGWWVLTRCVVVPPRATGRSRLTRPTSFLSFAPIAPVVSICSLLTGLIAVSSPLEVHFFLGSMFLPLVSLGFWGFVATIVSFVLWALARPEER